MLLSVEAPINTIYFDLLIVFVQGFVWKMAILFGQPEQF